MAKKAIIAGFVFSIVLFIISGVTFLRESGLLRKRPDPHYLTDEEAELRPVYEQLSKSEKAAYEALYRGISEMKEEIPLPRDLDGDTYSKLYCLIEKQEAELFYVSSTYYTAKIVGDAKIMYREDAKTVEEKQLELSVAVKKALNMISGAKSESELARRIHDYIIRHCAYNIGDGMPYSSTVYGCLVGGEANCEGYAKTFNLLASRVGLKSVLVTGTTDDGENHAWNQVNIDGQWYNVDVTWDDTDVSGVARRTYFLCDDEEFGRRHIADNELFESFKCGDDSRDHYVSNDLVADSLEKAEAILRREMKKGNDEIQMKFAAEELFDGFREHFIDNQRIFDVAVECGADRGGSLAVTLEENEENLCITVFLSRG